MEMVNSRFLDVSEEPEQVLLPIRGYEKEQLLPLAEAVQPLDGLLDDLDMMVDTAKRNSKKPKDGLTPDESAAIHLYTMQLEEPHVSVYAELNSRLRSERRESLKPWFRYLKLLLTALYKLPSVKSTVWRGVRGNLTDQYDDDKIWWGFSSCTESVNIIEQFVGQSMERTLFSIECISGKAIRAHSFYKSENEIVLMPGTYLHVVGKGNPAKGLYIIHLREMPAPRPYLEPPFKPSLPISFTFIAPSSTSEFPTVQSPTIPETEDPSNAFAPVTPSDGERFWTFLGAFLQESAKIVSKNIVVSPFHEGLGGNPNRQHYLKTWFFRLEIARTTHSST